MPEADLPVTWKLLQALAVRWDVAPVESEGEFTEKARADIEAAEVYFDDGGSGIRHEEITEEFGVP